MEYRQLGNSGETVSAVGVGTWVTGGRNWGGADDEQSDAAFHRAVDLGVNFFDTAPVYGLGRAERVLSRVLRKHRSKIFLATKFGLRWEREGADSIHNNLRPESIRAECDASLKRLGIDAIDLYQCHWPLPGDAMTRTVCEDMIETLISLRDLGKVRRFGVSNFTIEQIEMCGGAESIAAVQPPLSILRPGAARELIPWCRERGIGIACYSPLFRGLLTGKYDAETEFPEDDSRREHPDYQGERLKQIVARVRRLGEYAETHNTTIACVSLNWVISTPGVTAALAGTRTAGQIEESVGAAGWSLSAEERSRISSLFEEYAKIPD